MHNPDHLRLPLVGRNPFGSATPTVVGSQQREESMWLQDSYHLKSAELGVGRH